MISNNLLNILLIMISIFFFTSCEENYTPKQKGYIRHHIPKNGYRNHKKLNQKDTIFSRVSKYAIVLPKESKKNFVTYENIYYPPLNATIHLSYYNLTSDSITLESLIKSSRTYVYDHTAKASRIKETYIENNENNTYGMLYDIKGNAASNFQFYLTDSTKNYIRGSLYFNNRPNEDSLKPYLAFIRSDMDTLVNSFKF